MFLKNKLNELTINYYIYLNCFYIKSSLKCTCSTRAFILVINVMLVLKH